MNLLRVAALAGMVFVHTFAIQAQAVDYKTEMVRFVQAVAERGRAAHAGFGVFPQNAGELGAVPEYLDTVTGMGQEDTYFGYVKDGKATRADVTAQIEANLDVFVAAGKLVLTVDYPFRGKDMPRFNKKTRKKVGSAYQRALSKAYVPYCTVRNLDYLVVSPGHEPRPNEPPITDWSQVREFTYQLQHAGGQDRAAFLSALGSSGYDLVVMDYSFDGSGGEEFTAGEVAGLKAALGGRFLAYLSMGEAESYRWYWDPSWDADHDGVPDPGAPSWLDRENPDWPGNYKVRYWEEGWRQIVLAYLDKILAQGFDGVYLDLVDAYQYYEPSGPLVMNTGWSPPEPGPCLGERP